VKQDLGHPRKYSEGWEGANEWIYISTETFVKWRRLREERITQRLFYGMLFAHALHDS